MRTAAAIVHVVLGERKWVGALKYKPGDPVKRSITFYGWPDSKSAATPAQGCGKTTTFWRRLKSCEVTKTQAEPVSKSV